MRTWIVWHQAQSPRRRPGVQYGPVCPRTKEKLSPDPKVKWQIQEGQRRDHRTYGASYPTSIARKSYLPLLRRKWSILRHQRPMVRARSHRLNKAASRVGMTSNKHSALQLPRDLRDASVSPSRRKTVRSTSSRPQSASRHRSTPASTSQLAQSHLRSLMTSSPRIVGPKRQNGPSACHRKSSTTRRWSSPRRKTLLPSYGSCPESPKSMLTNGCLRLSQWTSRKSHKNRRSRRVLCSGWRKPYLA